MKDVNVKLTFYEIYMGANVGVARRLASMKRGETNKVQNKDFGWHTDIESACAEVVVAKYLNIFWDGSINTFKLPDVGEFQVKHTQYENGSLLLRKEHNPSYSYILVTGTHPDYVIRGYLAGSEGMKDEYLSNPNNTKDGEAFFVPQSKLKDISDLKKSAPREQNSECRYPGKE